MDRAEEVLERLKVMTLGDIPVAIHPTLNDSTKKEHRGELRVLQRVVFPLDDDPEVAPLYYEGELVAREGLSGFSQPCPPNSVLGRRSIRAAKGATVSTGTYFNMLPASYWTKWTKIRLARLVVIVSGTGAVEVLCTDERGNDYPVTSREFINADHERIEVAVSLSNFVRGGSYWFDLIGPADADSSSRADAHSPVATSDDDAAVVEEAWWEADSDRAQGTLSIGVTTYNHPTDVVSLLKEISAEPELLAILDDVYIVDQGTQHCQDEPDFAEVEVKLGDRLHLIAQGNLGGSGGISRGMYETLKAGKSTYHLISDDDVKVEPESLLRAVTFSDHAKKPLLVGGHMFSLTQRAHLHSWGEHVNMEDFWWTAVLDEPFGANFDSLPFRVDPLLHHRIDVDYNGWWMELVPVSVIDKLGLSLPFFIKWDDAEFGLRAKAAGIPTVTLPGVACWHMPWVEKTDGTDWQAYYHARNRVVSALLHSPKRLGGRVLGAVLTGTINHLFSQQYSAAHFRNDALQAVLSGPGHMEPELGTKRGEIQKGRASYPDAVLKPDASEFPQVIRRGRPRLPLSRRRWKTPVGRHLGRAIRIFDELLPVNPRARKNPEVSLTMKDATPGQMLKYDSALVTMPDKKSVAMYVRDRKQFITELRRAYQLDARMRRHWSQLARQYQRQAEAEVSVEAWEKTFGITPIK